VILNDHSVVLPTKDNGILIQDGKEIPISDAFYPAAALSRNSKVVCFVRKRGVRFGSIRLEASGFVFPKTSNRDGLQLNSQIPNPKSQIPNPKSQIPNPCVHLPTIFCKDSG
jgi:hypothetical protein